jgi:hypothetical protein
MTREAPNTVIEVRFAYPELSHWKLTDLFTSSWNTSVSPSPGQKTERSTNEPSVVNPSNTGKVVKPTAAPLLPTEQAMRSYTRSTANR